MGILHEDGSVAPEAGGVLWEAGILHEDGGVVREDGGIVREGGVLHEDESVSCDGVVCGAVIEGSAGVVS